MQDSDPARHQVYLLTLWREAADAPWRAALRHAGTQERIGFADLFLGGKPVKTKKSR